MRTVRPSRVTTLPGMFHGVGRPAHFHTCAASRRDTSTETKIARIATDSAAREPSLAGPTRFSSLVAAPAMAVLSEIDGCALCYPAFLQLVLIRERHRDGVNHAETRALS